MLRKNSCGWGLKAITEKLLWLDEKCKMSILYTLSLPGMFFEVAWLNLNVLPLSSVDQICSVVEVCLKLRTSNDWNLKKCQHIVIMFSFIPLALRYGNTLYVKQKHLFCTSFWDILLFFIFLFTLRKKGLTVYFNSTFFLFANKSFTA